MPGHPEVFAIGDWGFIHVLYLIGWGNRLGTVYTWACALTFSHGRCHRIITMDEAYEHAAAREGAG
ncbi:MAG: hypothetical protein L0H84_16150 [Pseudonocardia sp.]|nr:hypothetical protein [Pseudonocardia sp.]